MAKAKVQAPKDPKAPQSYHYYATTVVAWRAAHTRAEAIAQVIAASKRMLNPDDLGGMYVFSCRVDAPKTAYRIDNYVPQNVPVADVVQGSFRAYKKRVVLLTEIK